MQIAARLSGDEENQPASAILHAVTLIAGVSFPSAVGRFADATLLGDALVTSKRALKRSHGTPRLPLFGAGTRSEYGGHHVFEAVRKVSVISDDLAVAWTGNFAAAAELVGRLREEHPADSDSVDALVNDQIERRPHQQLGIVYVLRSNGQVEMRATSSRNVFLSRGSIDSAGSFVAAGKGWPHFGVVLNELSPAMRAAAGPQYCAHIVAELLLHELASAGQSTLAHGFGGAYDMVGYFTSGFAYYSMSLTILRATLDRSRSSVDGALLRHFEHWTDDCFSFHLCTGVQPGQLGDADLMVTRDADVPRRDVPDLMDRLGASRLQAGFRGCYVQMVSPEGKVVGRKLFRVTDDNAPLQVELRVPPGLVAVRFDQDALRRLCREIEAVWPV